MRCLGIDYGTKRIGLAWGDELGIATPLPAVVDPDPARQLVKLGEVVKARRPQRLVVGYPYNMDGTVGFKAKEVDAFIEKLAAIAPGIEVERVDERLTSRVASQGLSLKRERELRASGVIDSAAAAVILQDFLDRMFPPTLPSPEDFNE